MRIVRRTIIAVILTAALLATGLFSNLLVRPAQAIDIGDILKVGGIVLVVSTFGSQINDFINSTLGQREAAVAGATKVVPIFSVGRGAYVGAAQVVGLPASIRTTQGVAAVETEISALTGSLLVPITTRSASGTSLNRVSGVGISAIMDFHI
jgi:hypothetical protein